jgi:hypothetical protein
MCRWIRWTTQLSQQARRAAPRRARRLDTSTCSYTRRPQRRGMRALVYRQRQEDGACTVKQCRCAARRALPAPPCTGQRTSS